MRNVPTREQGLCSKFDSVMLSSRAQKLLWLSAIELEGFPIFDVVIFAQKCLEIIGVTSVPLSLMTKYSQNGTSAGDDHATPDVVPNVFPIMSEVPEASSKE